MLATACFFVSILLFWGTWICSAFSVPYAAGYLVHSYRGDSRHKKLNWRRFLNWNLLAIMAFALSFGLATAAAALAPSGEAGSFAYAVGATLGALPAFGSLACTTWYGPVAFIASTFGAFLVYGLVGALLTRNPARPAGSGVPMALAACLAVSATFVLVHWLPVGGSFSIRDYPTGSGFYLPATSLALLVASGVPAGYLVAHFEYASGVGFPWILHAVGGLAGVVAGSAYFAAMAMNIPSTEAIVVAAVRIAGFAAPSVGALFASIYIHALVAYHRDGYSGSSLQWTPGGA